MIKSASSTAEHLGFAVSGERFVHSSAGANIQEIRRCPDAIFLSRLDSGKDGGIDGVGMFLHGVTIFRQKYVSNF
jgi:hypothetical protein